jgi:predicted permease
VAHLNIQESGLQVQPDTRVLLFTLVVCMITGILFGLVPALRALHIELNATLKNAAPGAMNTGGKRGPHWGKVLVTGQVALSLLVLFAAGLLVRSLQNLRNVDIGFKRDHVLTASVDPLAAGYNTVQKSLNLERELRTRLAQLPGVQDVSVSQMGLFSGSACATNVAVVGWNRRAGDDDYAFCEHVGPNYFRMLKLPILLGRDIGEQDTANSARVTVVNQKFVDHYFPNQNPIGQKIFWDDDRYRDKPMEIVGVVGNALDRELKDKIEPQHYMPISQIDEPSGVFRYAIRTANDPKAMTEAVRNAIKEVDPALPVDNIRTLDSLIDNTINNEIIIAKLSSFFGILALVLASIGLYGVMSYMIAGRTRELGLRIALGAQRGTVLGMVMKECMILVAIGIVVGIPSAIAVSRVITSMLYGLKPYDPLAMTTVVILLSIVGAFAGFIPARRATKVDPMVALRYE